MQPNKALPLRSTTSIELQQNKAVPIPWLRRIFGCRHKKMSSPITRDNQTYSTCLDCGARRRFDTMKWKLTGPYYN